MNLAEELECARELGRLVDRPILRRCKADARAIRTTALVGPAERGGGRPGRRDELRDAQSRGEQLLLQRGDILGIHQLVIDGGDGILPEQLLLRHHRAEVTRTRPHVAVRELEPGARERVGELVGVLVEALRDLEVDRIFSHRDVGGGHHRRVPLGLVMRVGHGTRGLLVCRSPLVRAGGALGQLPLVAEERVEVARVPFDGIRRPGAFEAAGRAVHAFAAAEAILPSESLLFDRSAFRRRADEGGVARAVHLAEGVSARGQRDGLLVVHRHACEGLADVHG